MKIKKISCALLSFLIVLTSSSTVFAEKKNGFDIDSKNYNIHWSSREGFPVYSDKKGEMGTVSYLTGLARKKGTNDYILMTKEIMKPNSQRVKIKNGSGYGYSEFVSVDTYLPDLDDYEPKNRPLTKDSLTFSLGASTGGKGGSGQIGVSYSITHQDLDITSKCDSSTGRYIIEYDYIPDIIPLPNHNNKYAAYQSEQYGLAEFDARSRMIKFTVKYIAKFGTSMNEARSPIAIAHPPHYTFEARKNRQYSFTISK